MDIMGGRRIQNQRKQSAPELDSGSSAGPGTVLLLHDEETLTGPLLALFEREKLPAINYSCFSQLLHSTLPKGPACLVACVSGDAKCGLRAYEQLKMNGIYLPVIFLAKTCEIPLMVQAMRAGAEDFLSVPVEESPLLAALARVFERAARFIQNSEAYFELRQRAALLTEREREVVKLVVAGLLNKEIADHLGLALVTVKVHRGNAMHKLGARTGAELARMARTAGIVSGSGEATAPESNQSNALHNGDVPDVGI